MKKSCARPDGSPNIVGLVLLNGAHSAAGEAVEGVQFGK